MHKAPQKIALAVLGERTALNKTRNFLGTPGGGGPQQPLTWRAPARCGA